MNIFKRFFSRKNVPILEEPRLGSNFSFSVEPLRMDIYQAVGGTIIETKTYDRLKDRTKSSLYIIQESQDLSQEISKIITYSHLGG